MSTFLQIGVLNPQLNIMLLSLVTKVKNAWKLGQFRPINLCNFIYNIISKVLANRLAQVLNKILIPHQHNFIKERSFYDNILANVVDIDNNKSTK